MTQTSSPRDGDVTLKAALTPGGVTSKSALAATPRYLASITTVVGVLTVEVSMVTVAVVAPAAIETLAGTLATSGLLDSRTMIALPVGAGAVSLTVAVD